MKLWTAGFDVNNKSDFPQLLYKNKVMSINEQAFLTNKLFDLFLLTHRDKKMEIKKIKNTKQDLPFKKLYHLILDDEPFEFELEYMVFLLNFFSVEVD